jgi:hypothetical protein
MLRTEDDVRLNIREYKYCIKVGSIRNKEALRMRCQEQRKLNGRWEKSHFIGAVGEFVVLKHQGAKKIRLKINTFKREPDINPDIEVRTRTKSHYDLIFREKDDPNRKYVLVVRNNRAWNVVGWLWGREIKKHDEWIDNHGGWGKAWFAPQYALRKITPSANQLSNKKPLIEGRGKNENKL